MDESLGSIAGLTGPAVMGFVAVLFLLIGVLLVRKLSRGAKTDSDATYRSNSINLIELKKKGLLTPEELERVGQSMLRQMEMKEQARRKKGSVADTKSLLLDPEVRRLEALAAAAKPNPELRTGNTGSIIQQGAPTHGAAGGEAATAGDNVAAAYSAEELERVELPLDVQQMVDAGLLMPDEVLKIKSRILLKQQAK